MISFRLFTLISLIYLSTVILARPIAQENGTKFRRRATIAAKVLSKSTRALSEFPAAPPSARAAQLASHAFPTSGNSSETASGLGCCASQLAPRDTISLRTPGTTFYRGIPEGEKSLNVVGGSPKSFKIKQGDFSRHGGYYMFSDLDLAKWYSNGAYTDPGTRIYTVVTLEWNPPEGIEVKSFPPAGDEQWRKFVDYNWCKFVVPHDGSGAYGAIEGPFSEKITTGKTLRQLRGDGTPVMQYAVIDQYFLRGLTVTSVEDFKYDKEAAKAYGSAEFLVPK